MDLRLIERFLQAMMPPSGMPAVNTAFQIIGGPIHNSTAPISVMIAQFQMELFSEKDEAIQAKATRLVLTGIMLAWMSENPILKKQILEDYVERSAKLRGEHIISFHDRKAGR